MGKVVAQAIMSLDGYVAKQDNTIGRLFDWLQHGEVEIPTPYGTMTLKLHPGTQTGTMHRVKGKGLPRLGEGGRGDLYVRVHVWTPTKLTAEQRALLEQLAQVETTPPSEERVGRKFWEQLRQAFGGR